MARQRSYDRLMTALKSGEIGEVFLRSLRKALHTADRQEQGYSTSETAPRISAHEADAVKCYLAAHTPRIEPTQTAKGLAWLQSKKVQRELGTRERSIIADFDHFTLSDMKDVSRSDVAFYVPVYTVHAKDGRTFRYYVGSWQSGVPLTVVG